MAFQPRIVSLRSFLSLYLGPGFFCWLAGVVVLFVLSTPVFALYSADRNSRVTSSAAIAEEMYSAPDQIEKESPERLQQLRRQTARQILALQEEGFSVQSDYGWIEKESYLEQLERIKRTGEPLEVPKHTKTSWGAWWQFWNTTTVRLIMVVGLQLSLLVSFALVSDSNRERYADLPWRQVWPWLFVLLTSPFSWLPFGISARAMHRDGRSDPENGSTARRLQTASVRRNYVTSESARREALSFFTELKGRQEREKAKLRHRELISGIDEETQKARRLSREVKDAQHMVEEYRRELRDLEESGLLEGAADVDPILAEDEFQAICNLPGFLGIERVGSKLNFYFHSQYQSKLTGVLDGGDWRISFGSGASKEIERLREPHGREGPTLYGTWNFCFGNRADDIESCLRARQYGAALSLMVEGINHVNQEHLGRLGEFFSSARIDSEDSQAAVPHA